MLQIKRFEVHRGLNCSTSFQRSVRISHKERDKPISVMLNILYSYTYTWLLYTWLCPRL